MPDKKQCPEFPYFGASYPDARCIDGLLWDLDSEDEGCFTKGGDDYCPFCHPQQAYESLLYCLDYTDQKEGESDKDFEQRMDLEMRERLNAFRQRYGFEPVTFTPQPTN